MPSARSTFGLKKIGDDATRECHERNGEADADEDGPRFLVSIAGTDEALLQLAHLRRRLRCVLRQLLQRPDGGLLVGGRVNGHAADLTEAARNEHAAAWRQEHRRARDEQRDEQESEQREQQRHAYTSILMTLRIQTYPIVCMTIAPMIIIWPIRSLNSRSMCSGLMKFSATPSAAGSAIST